MAKRTYEFRGRQKADGSWIFGDLVQDRNTGECFICEPNSIDEMWGVDPSTVGQFTERLDKDGNKIFEGDLVEDTELGVVYEIRWDSYATSYGYFRGNESFVVTLWQKTSGILKIVGNIHE